MRPLQEMTLTRRSGLARRLKFRITWTDIVGTFAGLLLGAAFMLAGFDSEGWKAIAALVVSGMFLMFAAYSAFQAVTRRITVHAADGVVTGAMETYEGGTPEICCSVKVDDAIHTIRAASEDMPLLDAGTPVTVMLQGGDKSKAEETARGAVTYAARLRGRWIFYLSGTDDDA